MVNQHVQTRFLELLAKKQRLERRAISREQVAIETGISISSVRNWAANALTRFDSKQIVTFCEYFNCELGDLLVITREEGDETPESQNPLVQVA